MELERKTFEFKIDDLDEEGKFSGYLSTFGNVDEGGDLVEKGAFKKTLEQNRAFPLIIQHQAFIPSLAVGSFEGREDNWGLKINGEFFIEIEDGQKAYRGVKNLLKNKVRVGLSMGYKTIKKEDDEIDGIPVRRLKEVKLYEGSLTLFPMNEQALLEVVKTNGVVSPRRVEETFFKVLDNMEAGLKEIISGKMLSRHMVDFLSEAGMKIKALLNYQDKLMEFSDYQQRKIGWRAESIKSIKERIEQLGQEIKLISSEK